MGQITSSRFLRSAAAAAADPARNSKASASTDDLREKDDPTAGLGMPPTSGDGRAVEAAAADRGVAPAPAVDEEEDAARGVLVPARGEAA